MSTVELSRKRGFDDRDDQRCNPTSPSRCKRLKFHDSSRSDDYSTQCEAVPSRSHDHSRDSSRNQLHTPRRDLPRRYENFKVGATKKMNSTRDSNRNGDSVSPQFHPTDHFTSENPKEISVTKANQRHDFPRKSDSVSSRLQEGPRENLIDSITVKVNENHDLSRKYDSVSPRFQDRPSEDCKEGVTAEVNQKRDFSGKYEATCFQGKTSENYKKGQSEKTDLGLGLLSKSGAVSHQVGLETTKVKPSENFIPGVANPASIMSCQKAAEVKTKTCETRREVGNSEGLMPSFMTFDSTKAPICHDNFKKRKVNVVREFPRYCGALTPRVTIRRCDDNSIVVEEHTLKSLETSSSGVAMPESTRLKVVNEDIEGADVEKELNDMKDDQMGRNFISHVAKVLNEPFRSKASKKFAGNESFDSSAGFVSKDSGNFPWNVKSWIKSPTTKDDMAPSTEQISGGDSIIRKSKESDLEEGEFRRPCVDISSESVDDLEEGEFRPPCVDIPSEPEDDCRAKKGNWCKSSPDFELSPHVERYREDDYPVNAEYGDEENINSPSYSPDIVSSPFEDHYEVSSEDDCVDISSESEDECRTEMGNRRECSPDFELWPLVDEYREDDDYPVNAENGDDENINSPCYSPDIVSSRFEDHNEVSSEDDSRIVGSKNSDLFPSKDKRFNDLKISPLVNSEDSRIRKQVLETLDLYNQIYEELVEKNKAAEAIGQGKVFNTPSVKAATLLKDRRQWVNTKKVLGDVPGVEIGDRYRFRGELVCIGLHRQFNSGIDYIKQNNGKLLATSVVHSGRYDKGFEYSDVLKYSGHGGNPNVSTGNKNPHDQELKQGNRALKNSMDAKTPVRVIRKSMITCERPYFYDGLYIVTKMSQERSQFGKLRYMFDLTKMESGKAKVTLEKKLPCVIEDISHGKERTPIRVVNSVDDMDFPSFNYIKNMSYPPSCFRYMFGCDCSNGCSDSKNCRCVTKNGGGIPFNEDGSILKSPNSKKYIYECGPSCKCPPSCKNRVSQYGIKYRLEVFKTESKGWGLRSRDYIPAGSFICEYVGELIHDDQEEEKRTGNDEYLFDIGSYGYTIDATKNGNVGRFINHSCSPSLYAQNVLYEHDNKRMAHVMFFTVMGISPSQELTYDYDNYKLDQGRDSNGDTKKKKKACRCDSTRCRGSFDY